MKLNHALLVAVLIFLLPRLALAQNQDEPGRVWGDYTVHSSVELGGHIADAEGNQNMYETMVDLHSGPRLLEQELTMQSNTRVGGFFDSLYTSSFGFGGDPEGMARLRMEKHHWYNFVALYRRDKNVFDYDLFGNPLNLNAGIVTCGTTCTNQFTPSALSWFSNTTRTQWTTRNMGDFSLTLLPQSKVSLRLGYSRNASYGAIGTTLEAPLRSLLLQDSQWRSDRFQFGVDLKGLSRTTISLDVFYERDKNDIGYLDNTNLLYTLGNAAGQQILFQGQPLSIDTGLLYPPLSGTLASCAGNNVRTIFSGSVFLLNSGCNGILMSTGSAGTGYFRTGNVRTSIPTGQVSFQTTYFRNLDITGSAIYSSSASNFLNFTEFAHYNTVVPAAPAPGTVSTSNSNLFLINGAPSADRSTANADLGVTYHINKSLSVSDKFRWVNWRQHGLDAETRYGCFLSSSTYATAVGTTGTFASLMNPCFNGILNLINPAGGPVLIGTAGTVGNGRGNYSQANTIAALVGERSYFNTFKVNWQPNRHIGGYIGYRFTRRSFQDGNEDITGILASVTANFVNNGTGTAPTTPRCNVATAGCDPATGLITNAGGVDSEEINQHTALLGVVVRPIDAWRINGDLEWQYADNAFILIYPRHQQRVRVYSTYKIRPWLIINGGLHFVESRQSYAASMVQDDNGATPGALLFPASFIPTAYGHKDHWRYYTLGATVTKGRLTLDAGWTMQDQNISTATCMPVPANAFTGSLTAPLACGNGATARALLLAYQETTHSGYTDISFKPVKRVTLSLGYAITSDAGSTDWLRADTGLPLQVVGDIYGNSPTLAGNPITPCPGASTTTGCIYPGPFPDQPLGPQASNWTNAHAGIAVDVVKGVQFKGFWNYYDYNSKDHPASLAQLTVTAPRDFHANVGTISLRYSF